MVGPIYECLNAKAIIEVYKLYTTIYVIQFNSFKMKENGQAETITIDLIEMHYVILQRIKRQNKSSVLGSGRLECT